MMPASPKLVYLDANVIIRFIESQDENLLFLFEQAAVGAVELVTSDFTLAEVLVAPLKTGDLQLASIYESFLAEDEFLAVAPVDRQVLRRSAEIRAQSKAKGPDALHIATADLRGCTVFLSADKRLALPPNLVQLDPADILDVDRWL